MWLNLATLGLKGANDPAIIIAVSTSLPQYRELYSQARELGRFMLRKMKFERLATFHSSSLPPEVVVSDDGTASLPGCYVHVMRGKRDVLLLTGDSSPVDDQYEFARVVLDYARRLGVKELYSVGTRWAENPLPPDANPQLNGFSTDSYGVDRLRKCGVRVIQEEPAPFFASIIVALAGEYGIRGYKLSVDHGEPSPHRRAVVRLVNVLSAMLGFKVSTNELLAEASLSPEPKPKPERLGNDTIYH